LFGVLSRIVQPMLPFATKSAPRRSTSTALSDAVTSEKSAPSELHMNATFDTVLSFKECPSIDDLLANPMAA